MTHPTPPLPTVLCCALLQSLSEFSAILQKEDKQSVPIKQQEALE